MDLDRLLAPSHALGAEWSISIRRDDSSALVEHRPAAILRTASIAKVFVLMEVADRLRRGTLFADDVIDRRSALRVHDSGLWQALRADRLTVADLAVLVGAVSDNWATNALIDVCGLPRVQQLAAASAPAGSMLHDYLRDERSGDAPSTVSVGCAGDWSAIMQRLYYDADEDVLRWLARDTDLSMVATAFDLDPLAHDEEDLGLRLWHKTGTDRGVRADVGIVRSSSAVVSYAVLCNWPETDTTPETRHTVLTTMRAIGAEAVRPQLG